MIKKFYNLAKENKKHQKKIIFDLKKIIKSGFYITDKYVKKFENKFAKFNNSKHVIGVGNGFDALKLSLITLKLHNFCKEGDEVIVPANSYIATMLPVNYCSLKPVFVEPEIDTFNIDPEQIEKKITKKTKVIIVTHLYGHMCQMDKIVKIVKKYNLKLIEDCSQSHGATFGTKKCGNFGDFGCFSLFPAKNLGALSDAGVITTKNKNFSNTIRSLRNYGEENFINYQSRKYLNKYKGLNSRMSEINGAVLCHKIVDLKKENLQRKKKATVYLDYIKNANIVKPKIKKKTNPVWHQFIILCKKRNELKKLLLKKGYETKIIYPIPPHKQPAYEEFKTLKLPITEKIHSCNLSLPIASHFSFKDIKKIINIINGFK